MAIEKKWPKIDPIAFIADGGSEGEVQIESTIGFKVKQIVIIKATGLPDLILEVKRVVSDTLMFVGKNGNICERADLSLYIMATNPMIRADEQIRPKISPEEYERASYEEEPTIAKRVIGVDRLGNPVDSGQIKAEVGDKSLNVSGDQCPGGGEVSLHVAVQNDAFTKQWDDLEVTIERSDGQPEEIISRKAGVDQQRAVITYNTAGDFKRIQVFDL